MSKAEALFAVIVLGLVLFGANLGGHDLWAPDEPRFAQIAREILDTGDWMVLRVNGTPYFEKPPLFFWAIAALSVPFGDTNEVTARVPSVLAAIAVLVCTFFLGDRLFGRRVAFWASVILATTLRFWWQARYTQTDMLLTGCLAIALYAFWMRHETRKSLWLAVFYAAIAAAVLTKGPAGLIFPGLLIASFYWRRKAERRSLHWFLGFLAIAAVVCAWWIPAHLAAGAELGRSADESIGGNMYRQVIGRAFLGVSKANTPTYYLTELPLDLVPWTIFLPWTILWVWRNRRGNEPVWFLLCWTVPAFLVFSAISGKRAQYLLPLYPAFALLLSRSILDLMESARSRWRVRTAWAWIAFLVVVGLGPFVVLLTPYKDTWSWVFLAFPAAALILATECGLHAILDRARALHLRVAAGFTVLAILAAFLAFPAINQFKSARDFCRPLWELSEAGAAYRLYSVQFSREEYIYYAKHAHKTFLVDEFPDEKAMRAFEKDFASNGPAFLFIQKGDWNWVAQLAPHFHTLHIVGEDTVGRRHVLLVANDAGAALLAETLPHLPAS